MELRFNRTVRVMIIVVAVTVGLVVLGVQAARRASVASGKIQVVAAENFWGSIAAQIGGTHVRVTSIISDPNADPHLYESDARDAAAVGSARLVIENGLGYDDFIDKLLNAAPSSRRYVLSAQKILGITGTDPNPHIWYDTSRVPIVAAAIGHQLATADPANAAAYATNLAAFDVSLQPISATVAAIKHQYAGTPIAYTERVPGYLLASAGLAIKTPPGFASAIEDGNEPSPADAAAMDSLITTRSIKVLLYNAQATSAVTEHIKTLAKQAGIPIVAVTETLPTNQPTYQAWQLSQAQALLAALGGKNS